MRLLVLPLEALNKHKHDSNKLRLIDINHNVIASYDQELSVVLDFIIVVDNYNCQLLVVKSRSDEIPRGSMHYSESLPVLLTKIVKYYQDQLLEELSKSIDEPVVEKVVNYLVHISHREPVPCTTEKEAWDALGKRSIGSTYHVTSPTGLSCSTFVPY